MTETQAPILIKRTGKDIAVFNCPPRKRNMLNTILSIYGACVHPPFVSLTIPELIEKIRANYNSRGTEGWIESLERIHQSTGGKIDD